jgi:hypothetical protein
VGADQALTDIDSIGDKATTGVLTVVAFAAPSQAPPQSAALMFVLPDHLIDAFTAYCGVVFFLEPGPTFILHSHH